MDFLHSTIKLEAVKHILRINILKKIIIQMPLTQHKMLINTTCSGTVLNRYTDTAHVKAMLYMGVI